MLHIVDGLAPFFTGWKSPGKINWSKIPFKNLERDGCFDPEKAKEILRQFDLFAARAAETGFNAISLDDVAHLTDFDFYPEALSEKIGLFQELFDQVLESARRQGLRALMTTDVMFFNRHIEKIAGKADTDAAQLLKRAIKKFFVRFPTVEGIIVRIGESDGVDVEDDFLSRMVIRTPKAACEFLLGLLPIFEEAGKWLIFRTWTVGAYKIGDLIWNRKTFRQVFGRLPSERLIVSHKFGETDFFKYLELNPLFFEGPHRKIVELQARREYEGFGEFPSFVGYDYERYAGALASCEKLAGVHIYCQMGGWSNFNRLTFLDGASLWNEVNTFVSLKIFKEGLTAQEAATQFCRIRFPGKETAAFVELLRLSDEVIRELWYLPEFSRKTFYFRRLRVPPLLWVFWDTILVNHSLRKLLRRLVRDRKGAIDVGYGALEKIKEMGRQGKKLGIPPEIFEFQYDTFHMLAVAREYLLGPWDPSIMLKVESMAQSYESRYPEGFSVERDFSPLRIHRFILKAFIWMALRSQAPYRWWDRILLLRLTGWTFSLFAFLQRRRFPQFTRNQTMGIQFLLK